MNILGEHVDYSLFVSPAKVQTTDTQPVLPTAIEQDMVIALRPRTDKHVRVANLNPKFKPSEFDLVYDGKWDAGLVSPAEGGCWENYFKVALLECAERYFPRGPRSTAPVGMDVLITGNVPPGAGLSVSFATNLYADKQSSAAFVVSSVIAFLAANDLTEGVTKGDVVAMAIASEHRMGLRTGGMDQAASALSLAGSLLHLSFHPKLDSSPLPLPSNLAVVITNSLAPHALCDSAPKRYNLRVVEVLCASRLLLHAWGIDCSEKSGEDGRIWLREALDLLDKKSSEEELYKRALADLPSVLGKEGGWTREEMVAASGMSAEDFEKTYLQFIPVKADKFKLFERAEHTFSESLRVTNFVKLCKQGGDVGEQLGELLNGSHQSLRDQFEATVPEVEELRDLCLKNGALGARQTGGGWGGAVISLVRIEQVPTFLEKVKAGYKAYDGLSQEELDEAAFATLPGVGAGIYKVE